MSLKLTTTYEPLTWNSLDVLNGVLAPLNQMSIDRDGQEVDLHRPSLLGNDQHTLIVCETERLDPQQLQQPHLPVDTWISYD